MYGEKMEITDLYRNKRNKLYYKMKRKKNGCCISQELTILVK